MRMNGRLFALHGGLQRLLQHDRLFTVLFCFRPNSPGQKLLPDNLMNLGGMSLLVILPAHQPMVTDRGMPAQSNNLPHRLVDGCSMFGDHPRPQRVVIDTTRDFAMVAAKPAIIPMTSATRMFGAAFYAIESLLFEVVLPPHPIADVHTRRKRAVRAVHISTRETISIVPNAFCLHPTS